MKKIVLFISVVAIILISFNVLVANSYAIILRPIDDGYGHFYSDSPVPPRIGNLLKVRFGKDCRYSFFGEYCVDEWEVGIMEFYISSLLRVISKNQVGAVLVLTLKNTPKVSSDFPYACLDLYSIQDENENGIIELADIETADFIEKVCGPFQKETITFNVTAALEHDLFDMDQTGFSGFVLKPNTDFFLSMEFYDHTNLVYAPKLEITDSCVIDQIYGEHSIETELLRSIRDNVLSKSQEGRELIKLYYQWSPVIVKGMEADEEFKKDVKELFDEILELIGE